MFSLLATISALQALILSVSAVPFSFPLPNGFPAPSAQAIAAIFTEAHGSLPNVPPPPGLNQVPETFNSLRFIASNEFAEVAFFSELISNITKQVPGYTYIGDTKNIVAALNATVAQDELHVLVANGILGVYSQAPLKPCQYNFPVTSFRDAIALAATFTDLYLGTLQDIQGILGATGDVGGLIRAIASVLGQEGEQNGYFRFLQQKIPSSLPFLTGSTRELTYSYTSQNFVVPGSCPSPSGVNLPIFKTLNVVTQNIQPKSQKISYKIAPDSSIDYSTLSLVYINQQNAPVVTKLQNIQVSSREVTFQADFPYAAGTFGNGLTIAVLTTNIGPFADPTEVTKSTYAGPGLILIN